MSGGLTHKRNCDLQFKGEAREDWQTATQPGLTYIATSFLFGMRCSAACRPVRDRREELMRTAAPFRQVSGPLSGEANMN